MIKIELPTLISKLNEQSQLALEQAAALCMEHQHCEVTFEHYLYVLLDNPLGDVREMLRVLSLDAQALQARIFAALPKQTGHDLYPTFSPLLVEMLQEAWLLASAELGLDHLRSGVIFLTALLRTERYFDVSLARQFDAVNRETIRREFFDLLNHSSESVLAEDGVDAPAVGSAGVSVLDKYCQNMTEQARQHQFDPVLCRDDEINLMIDILCRRRKSNPIIVGDAGVGKSAVVEGLALRIVAGQVPESLKHVELYSLDLGLLQAGASVKGEFEKRLKAIVEDIQSSPNPIIVFIDEAHTLIGVGNQEGSGDAANLLKPALARGEVCAIAATTWKEYKKYFEKDPALSRRFQLIKLDAPSAGQTVDILRGVYGVYERAHQVLISDDALKAAAFLSDRYVCGRQLPDKAIDVMDTACARIAINLSMPPAQMTERQTQRHHFDLELNLLARQRQLGFDVDEAQIEALSRDKAANEAQLTQIEQRWEAQRALVTSLVAYRHQLMNEGEDATPDLKEKLAQCQRQWLAIPESERLMSPDVDARQIANVIADWTGVPVEQMDGDELTALTTLPSHLGTLIQGQELAIQRIHQHLLTARADLRRQGRPKGAFLLVGPSGVGKTETVVQLAQQLYGGKRFLTTINMSEYQEKHTVSRLIGSPPGYVGYGEGGVLTEAIRRMPYSVVLLDEVEKAHPDVLNLFYQAFDKGELVDGEGRFIDCQNIVFFLTSNLGDHIIVEQAYQPASLDDALYPTLAAFFKPALLARMEIVPYLPLGDEILAKIVAGKLSTLTSQLERRYQAEVVIAPSVVDEILSRTHRMENGARMLEAIMEGQMLPSLSLALLTRLAHQETVSHILLDVDDHQFVSSVS